MRRKSPWWFRMGVALVIAVSLTDLVLSFTRPNVNDTQNHTLQLINDTDRMQNNAIESLRLLYDNRPQCPTR